MPIEVESSPTLHEPHPSHTNVRPKGILKNPSFSGPTGHQSPTQEAASTPPSMPLDPQEAKEVTIANTLQNAGNRRSSSAARRSSVSRLHSAAAGNHQSGSHDEAQEQMRLKWDEANLYLAEQEAGGRMKITEPKTPFEYGNNAMDEDEDEDVSIDPRYVNVDEVEMAQKNRQSKKARESDIPGLELGEPEDENTGAELGNERIVRQSTLSRESSKEKHVNVRESERPMEEDGEKHKEFEEHRKKHYEMSSVKDLLGHPESLDEEDDEDTPMRNAPLPNRSANGGP